MPQPLSKLFNIAHFGTLALTGGPPVGGTVLTQRESLVSQAHVGLGGVAGGGLTHWADFIRFVWPWLSLGTRGST